MLSTDTAAALLGEIDAALDALFEVDLAGLPAGDLVRLAGRVERLVRRQSVWRADVALEVQRRPVAEVGGAAHRVLADWLRITPAEARRRLNQAEPLAARRALTGEPLPPRQPATAAAWRGGELDVEHVRVIRF